MEAQRRLGRDSAVSEFVATILLVGLVVAVGSILAVVVTANLSAPTVPSASLALAGVSPGDATVAVVLRNGEPLPLDRMELRLSRNGSAEVDVPRGSWGTVDPGILRAGERLIFAVSPPVAPGESIRVRLLRPDLNAQLGVLESRAAGSEVTLGSPTLIALFAPNATVADGATAALLTVRVTHPAGGLSIARVIADLSNATNASGSAASALPLGDAGVGGDAVGGDAVWSGLVTLSSRTPVGNYTIHVNATDLSGRVVGSASAPLRVLANGTGGGGGSGGTGGGSGGDGSGGNVTGGRCIGCIVQGGVSSYEGTRLTVPNAANVTAFQLTNWTWDKLHPERLVEDAMAMRVVNGSAAWSAYFTFGYDGGVAGIKTMVVWTGQNETTYLPRNGTILPLQGLTLEMNDPVATLQMVRQSGSAHPTALYRESGLRDNTTFIVAYMRDEDVTGTRPEALDIGIFSVDVVLA